MSVSAIAIVGKDNCPLIIRTKHDYSSVNIQGTAEHVVEEENARMKLIYLLHASLDVIDEKQHQLQSREPYLGLLNQCESYKIYGLLSTTKVKIILLVPSGSSVRDVESKAMLKQIQSCYIQSTVKNPFYVIGSEIKSKAMDDLMEQLLSK